MDRIDAHSVTNNTAWLYGADGDALSLCDKGF